MSVISEIVRHGASSVSQRHQDSQSQSAPSMLVDSIESGPSSDGATDTLIARRAGRLQFPNAIQRQRYIATTMALRKICGDT